MQPVFFLLRDFWSVWAIDRAGVQSGRHRVSELREMLDKGQITPKTWLRNIWTGRFALAGEVLFSNKLASYEEFDHWFPARPLAHQQVILAR